MYKRYAGIDIGTNTIKIKIIDNTATGKFEVVLYKDFPSCLGSNMRNNIIDPTGLEYCYYTLNEINKIIRENKVDEYKSIATHALRVAVNQTEILGLIKANTDLTVRVISGEEEAWLTLVAVKRENKNQRNFVCINGGGGSTELGFHLPEGDKLVSFGFGALNLYNDYFKDKKDMDSAMDNIRQLITLEFSKKVSFQFAGIDQVFSLGGSIFTGGYIYRKDKSRDFNKLANLEIPIKDLRSIINELSSVNEDEQRKIPGIDSKQLNTILPGILIHYFLLQLFKKDTLIISTQTISDGLIYSMAETNTFDC